MLSLISRSNNMQAIQKDKNGFQTLEGVYLLIGRGGIVFIIVAPKN